MTKKNTTTTDGSTEPTEATTLRRCIGSTKFGIEAHEAPVTDFPAQPSQEDGLGRMCKPHWTEYTRALRKAALARKGEAPTPAIGRADRQAEAARANRQHQAAQATGKTPASVAEVKYAKAARALDREQRILEATDAFAARGETPAAATRRAKLGAKLAEIGVASDEGQRILEAAGAQAARGRKPMAEAVAETVASD